MNIPPSLAWDAAEPLVLKSIPSPKYPLSVYHGPPLAMTEHEHRKRVRWRYNVPNGHPELIWLFKPSIESIKQVVTPYIQLIFPGVVDVRVEFFGAGSYNRAYTVTAIGMEAWQTQSYIFRVAAPTYPYYKIESEVATMELVRHSTSVRVPIVYAYSSSWCNAIGHEWILMEKVEGKRAQEVYDGWDRSTKIKMAKKVAFWTKELAGIKSDRIGSIYMYRMHSQLKFYVGWCVGFDFFIERNLFCPSERGPFTSLSFYYLVRLDFQISKMRLLGYPAYTEEPRPTKSTNQNGTQWDQQQRARLDSLRAHIARVCAQADEDDADDYSYRAPPEEFQKIIRDLELHEKNIFPLCAQLHPQHLPLCTVLSHHDIAPRNVMVNENDECVALLDWEYTMLRPAFFGPYFPQYMKASVQPARPETFSYGRYLHDDNYFERHAVKADQDEKEFLRPIYKQELGRIAPELAAQFWSSSWHWYRELHYRAESTYVYRGARPAFVDDPVWRRRLADPLGE
ncbi:MAG: hypothetical protein Q9191_006852 [Dirinaria sp. TL-2023a]